MATTGTSAERDDSGERPVRVLHLDDDESFVDLAARYLEREGSIEVETATRPSQALAVLDDADVDCVVSDFEMPEMDGLDFLRAVRERYPDLPFLLLTGKGSEEIAGEAISAGVTDYLQKETGSEQFTVLANRIENTVSQRRAQARAEENRTRVARVHERITDAVVAFDEAWRYTYVNGHAADLLGRDRDDLLGERVWDTFPALADTEFEAALRDAMATQETRTVEAYFPPLDTWFEARVYPDEDGISVYFRDVSERRERERRFDAIFNQTFQFTGLLEPDGTLVEANETALQFGGLDREDVIGKKVWNAAWFQHGNADELARAAVERAREGELVRDEIEVRGADGTAVIDFSVKPVTDEHGEVDLLIPEGRDITERKQRERELERQNERLEEFASVVSHDIQNHLGVASGSLSLLAEEVGDDPNLERARTALDRMGRLVEDVLDLAGRGRVVDDPEPVVARDIVDRAVDGVAVDADADVDLSVAVPADRELLVDPRRFPELVENLVRNAVEHAATDGRVTVEVGLDGDTLYVADDGPGVPEADREAVFDAGHTTSDDGTGFGLAIVESIAEAHGWAVAVTDSRWGGARFEVTGVESP